MHTTQTTFNTILAHLRTQDEPSMSSDSNNCAYRGDFGRSCAVGCVLPDNIVATYAIEGMSIRALHSSVIRYLLDLVPDELDGLGFFESCQLAHDWMTTYPEENDGQPWIDEVEIRMAAVAKKYNLTYTALGAA